VASYLVHDLHVDWRLGAAFFQQHLVDHDVSANFGNWLSIAGVSERGARVNRFNWRKQANDYDPKAEHAR
jgi:deoxyribodipyrimidine photo-lyase